MERHSSDMSVLDRTAIIQAMRETDYKKKLLISPILSENQIGPASIDVRLGS